MSKIIINSKIKSSDGIDAIENQNAIIKDAKIYYDHDGVKSVVELGNDGITISRRNDEFDMFLPFKKGEEKGKYIISDINATMDVKTVTKTLLIEDNKIKIEYDLYINDVKSDEFVYELDWRDEKWV